jgi:hypothetical protein
MTPPAWERRLAFAVAMHDTIVAGDHMLGRVSTEYPAARQRVVYLSPRACPRRRSTRPSHGSAPRHG